MLREYEKSFSNLQKLIDILIIITCWGVSYLIRFHYLPNAQYGLELLFLKLIPILIILTLYHFHKNNLYKSQRFTHRYHEIFSVIKGNTFALISFILLIYFFGDDRVSRLMIILYSTLSTLSFIIARLSIRNFLRALRVKGKNLRHVLLIGNGKPLLKYVKTVKQFKDSGIRFLGWMDSEGLAQETQIQEINISYEKFRENQTLDAIIISYSGKKSEEVETFIASNYNDIIPIQILPNLSYSLVGHHIEEFAGIPLLSVNQPTFNVIEIFFKRILDIVGSALGLILLFPLFLAIGSLIKLSSKGPIFYGQERLGLNGSSFTMRKFRTMKVAQKNEDKSEWSNKNNPRKTKIGNLLRKTSLDELPQLWNVFVGDMSLVGPRPEQPFFVHKFRREIPGYMLRHKMRAGITGWAQVNGWRGDTSLHKRIECDIYYIKHWSFWFDLKILFLTFFKGLINKNAY